MNCSRFRRTSVTFAFWPTSTTARPLWATAWSHPTISSLKGWLASCATSTAEKMNSSGKSPWKLPQSPWSTLRRSPLRSKEGSPRTRTTWLISSIRLATSISPLRSARLSVFQMVLWWWSTWSRVSVLKQPPSFGRRGKPRSKPAWCSTNLTDWSSTNGMTRKKSTTGSIRSLKTPTATYQSSSKETLLQGKKIETNATVASLLLTRVGVKRWQMLS